VEHPVGPSILFFLAGVVAVGVAGAVYKVNQASGYGKDEDDVAEASVDCNLEADTNIQVSLSMAIAIEIFRTPSTMRATVAEPREAAVEQPSTMTLQKDPSPRLRAPTYLAPAELGRVQ